MSCLTRFKLQKQLYKTPEKEGKAAEIDLENLLLAHEAILSLSLSCATLPRLRVQLASKASRIQPH